MSDARKRIFITGGTGFFGRSLLDVWRRTPEPACELTILSRNPERFLAENPWVGALGGIDFAAGDVRDFRFPSGHFDAVIHAATPASAQLERENPEEMHSIIVDGTARVLGFARSSGAKRLLLTSSGAVYGLQDTAAVSEEHPCRPVTVYGKGKLEAERLCRESGIDTVIARCFAFIGPRLPLDTHFAAGNFIGDALARRPILVRGDGRPLRSYLYADDLVRWLWALLTRAGSGMCCNVGSSRAVSIAELAKLCAVLQNPPLAVSVSELPSEGPPPRYIPDVTRAERELGLRETVSLEDALRRTFEFHRGNAEL